MQINRRVTNGLAWAGLFLVVGVPVGGSGFGAVDGRSGKHCRGFDRGRSGARAAEPAPSAPARQAGGRDRRSRARQASRAPVAKPRPSRCQAAPRPAMSWTAICRRARSCPPISPAAMQAGAGSDRCGAAGRKPVAPVRRRPPWSRRRQTATTPAGTPIVTDPVEVASVTPQKIAPIPMPLSMRPTPVPQPLRRCQPAADEIVIPRARRRADYDAPVDRATIWRIGKPARSRIFWRSRTHAARPQRSHVRREDRDRNYDADGFFLNDGPNRAAARRSLHRSGRGRVLFSLRQLRRRAAMHG